MGYDDGYDELWGALKEKIGIKSAPSTPEGFSISNLGSGIVNINLINDETATEYEVVEVIPNTNENRSIGKFSKSPILIQGLTDSTPYFYKVKAINEFGESDFTELLGTTPSASGSKVLIVNGFDRISGTTNSFDFILEHGNAIYINGYTFDSASNESVITGLVKLDDYVIVDWILGEEGAATSSFDEKEKTLVQDYIINGGRLFVSGSEIGYDLVEKGTLSDNIFYENILKSQYLSDAAGETNGVYEIEGVPNSLFDGYSFSFDNGDHGNYNVDWPDGIKPVGEAVTILKYKNVDYDTRGGAGIAYRGNFLIANVAGLVYLSFGFEAIYPEQKRVDVMGQILIERPYHLNLRG